MKHIDYVTGQINWINANVERDNRDICKEMLVKLDQLDENQKYAFIAGWLSSAIVHVASESDHAKRRLNLLLESISIAPLKDY